MKLSVIEAGKFKLDGGAMFGVVPKSMWQKLNKPDENNMCTWQMRCLLVEDGDRKILIDTGVGNKQNEKFRQHFSPHDQVDFDVALLNIGLKREDISDVLLTHFHFDHIGGALYVDEKNKVQPTFPNAKYWTNKVHYEWAYTPNAREAASFLKENFVPLVDMGMLHYIDVQQGIHFSDHITLDFVYGHTEAMMIPNIHLPSGSTLIYTADLIPSHHHISLPFVMAYDMKPLETLKEKMALYEKSVNDNHFLFFEHDLDVSCGSLTRNENGRVVYGQTCDISDL